MREIFPSRFAGDARDQGIQYIINEQPVTCTIHRPGGNTLTGNRTKPLIGAFECRIDVLSASPRTVEDMSKEGKGARVAYKILAQPVTDKNGNAVDIEHNDVATIDGVDYKVLYINRTSFSTEGVLEIIQ